MISVGQIKAARGLLDWNQADLAKAAGLHVNAINNVERRHGLPRTETLNLIQKAFEQHNIRFKGLTGVELVPEQLEIRRASGPQFIRILTDDILVTLTGKGDELLAVLPDEDLFMLDPGQSDRYYKAQKKIGFKQRMILSDNQGNYMTNPEGVRYLPESLTGKVSYQIYGDKFVLINWETHETILIRSASFALTFRNQFEYFWKQAKPAKARR